MNYTSHTHSITTPGDFNGCHNHTITTPIEFYGSTYANSYANRIYGANTQPWAQEYPTRKDLVTQPWIDPRTLPGGSLHDYIESAYDQIMANQRKEQKDMDTLNKLRAERKERKERERLEREYEVFDSLELDGYESGTVLRLTFHGSEKDYTYAAVFADGKWFVTGATGPNGVDTDDFITWMIRLGIKPSDIEVLDG